MFKKKTIETWHLPVGHKYKWYIYLVRCPSGKYKLKFLNGYDTTDSVTSKLFKTPEEAFQFLEEDK